MALDDRANLVDVEKARPYLPHDEMFHSAAVDVHFPNEIEDALTGFRSEALERRPELGSSLAEELGAANFCGAR